MKLHIIISIVLISANLCWATDRYVDTTCAAGAAYNKTTRVQGTGSDISYTTIAAAVSAMSAGDDIYLRGGTYTGSVSLSSAPSGTSDNYSSIQSYPGEWAIIDGNDNQGSLQCAIGVPYDGSTVAYWKFERLEITGGNISGIGVYEGPVIIRYCYIHDNYATNGDSNPAGIKAMMMRDSVIEYNYFKGNGSTANEQHSVAGVQIYSSYTLYGATVYTDPSSGPYNIAHCNNNNTIRYNLISNDTNRAQSGYHDKAMEPLTRVDQTEPSWTYQEYGNKIHHNMFLGFQRPIGIQQDFAQLYNNIISSGYIDLIDPNCTRPFHGISVYNNTLQSGGRINFNFGENYGSGDWSAIRSPYLYWYNNVFDQPVSEGSGDVYGGYLRIGSNGWSANDSLYVESRDNISNNYLYRPPSATEHVRILNTSDSCRGTMTVGEYQSSCGGDVNWTKASSEETDALFADTYITRGAHVITGSTTIANGGIGGAHPYLAGVTFPSYVGATNPSDYSWVAGVLALDASYFTSQTAGSDPTWIEGSTPSPTISGCVQSGGVAR